MSVAAIQSPSARRTQVVRGTVGASTWEMADREPCALLSSHVVGLSGYDECSPEPQIQRQFPAPYVVCIIEFGPPLLVTMGGGTSSTARHAGGFVSGLGDQFAQTEHAGHQRGIQVDLFPTAARRFFGLPLSELGGGEVVALRDVQPDEHRVLAEQLAELPDWVSRLDLVESILCRRILGAELDTRRVDHALGLIESSGGRHNVAEIARELGCSGKHLISLFRDQAGVPPKLLSRLVRFDRVMQRARSGAPLRWSDVALEYGFSDQAHLAREVRHFTGLSPTEARQHAPTIAELLG
jgi:AraC-like DNA-binding protein